jgi:hypothetical protein
MEKLEHYLSPIASPMVLIEIKNPQLRECLLYLETLLALVQLIQKANHQIYSQMQKIKNLHLLV